MQQDVYVSVNVEAGSRVNWLTSCGSLFQDDVPTAFLRVLPEDRTEGQPWQPLGFCPEARNERPQDKEDQTRQHESGSARPAAQWQRRHRWGRRVHEDSHHNDKRTFLEGARLRTLTPVGT